MKIFVAYLFAFILLLIPAVSSAEEAAHTPAMDEAAMQEMMKLGNPGEAHKVLDPLAGTWDYTITFKMMPDENAPEQTSQGTSVNEWVLGGRYLKQAVSGPMDMGGESVEYEGIGYLGYNNVENRYESLWIDNMNTAMMTAHGAYDPEARTITEEGTHYCPMRGKDVAYKSILHFKDQDHYSYVVYDKDADAEPVKMMEIEYTRKQ